MDTPVKKFNRYEIIEGLGIGGMATVYRAHDPLFDRDVAVKVLKSELLDDPELQERFERETKIVARLEHAAIVPVYDVGYENGQLFYVMRYMTGGSLAERINQEAFDLEQSAYILLRLADALDYAHRKGVIHRDIKPGNILFDEVGNAYLSDFGMAKFTQATTRITHSGIMGTPRYMSPEQARSDEVDGSSDQYSLSVIMFEMLSGHAPFEAAKALTLAFQHATEPAPNILDINPNLPPTLGEVFKKTLEKEPANRYKTVAEFANAFLEALPADTAPNAKYITPLPPRNPQKYETPPQAEHPKSRSKFPLWMIAGFIFLFLIGFAWGYPRLTATSNASTSTPEAVSSSPASTATDAPPTTTDIPRTAIATLEPSPTIEPTPTISPIFTIGGAVNIAFTSNREVFVMDVNAADPVQLTNTNIPKFDLQWLPNSSELLYGEDKCIYKVDARADNPAPEKLGCFTEEDDFHGIRVSPDGSHVAITIKDRLLILPFDLKLLSTVKSAFELQSSENICIDYSDVTVKRAQWSSDGKSIAILYQGPVGNLNRLGDTVRVLSVDLVRCEAVDPLLLDEFPGRRFTPEGYGSSPVIPSYHWDGDKRFVFNTLTRNLGYGDLYLYDMSTHEGSLLNPVNGTCCYHAATFSPDGSHILFAYQDRSGGSESITRLYYISLDAGEAIMPFDLPLGFFTNPRENILFALQTP